jgi:hypothetical protein
VTILARARRALLFVLLLLACAVRADPIVETEPNDTLEQANATRGTGSLDIAGSIAPGGADHDFFSFEIADVGRFDSPYDAYVWITIAGPASPSALVCFDVYAPGGAAMLGGCAPNGTSIGLYPGVQGGKGVYRIGLGPWQSDGPYRVSLLAQAKNGAIAPLLRGTEPLPLPLYRFDTGQYYFYTVSEAEKTFVQQAFPWWRFDGVAYHVHATPVSGSLPVYRFNTGTDHFYTIDENEKNFVLRHFPGWVLEGVAFHAFATPTEGTVPVYRFNGGSVHLYTASEAERSAILRQMPQWRFEGVAYYAVP